jgi:hypothetical protein
MNRRTFLSGLVATAAGVLIPGVVAAEPERRIWVLDQTMLPHGRGARATMQIIDEASYDTGWFNSSMPGFEKIPVSVTIGDQEYMFDKVGGMYRAEIGHDWSEFVSLHYLKVPWESSAQLVHTELV